jgi:hypothetical protein
MTTRRDHFAPWAALAAAGTGWWLHQRVVADALHFDCHSTAGVRGIAWGVLSLAIIAGGAWVSWRATFPSGKPAAPRRLAVHLGLMASLLATLGIVFNGLAAALLPGCPP